MSARRPALPSGDARLIVAVTPRVRRACRIGPFPITALDAARLRTGLSELSARDASRAAAIRARARIAVAAMSDGLPGDARSGTLSPDEEARDAFFSLHAALPCPALDPENGACELYAHRPISCRTFGPPMRIEGEDLPPCRLCFVGAGAAEVETARGRLDCLDLEEPERELERTGASGETLIAFALHR